MNCKRDIQIKMNYWIGYGMLNITQYMEFKLTPRIIKMQSEKYCRYAIFLWKS